MTDKNTLNLAREWAEYVREIPSDYSEIAGAAADLISSLPDEWVDAKELRVLADDMANWKLPHDSEGSSYFLDYRALVRILDGFTDRVTDLLPAPESASPRPEDVPEGEAWQVEVDGLEAIGYRNDPDDDDGLCWTVVRRGGGSRNWLYDSDVTLIARLVPEATEKEHGEVPCLLDKDGDHWVKVDGQWHMVDPDFAYDKLPDLHGPYRAFLQEDH